MRGERLLEAALDKIEEILCMAYWNKYQEEMMSPFDNTGNKYANDTFKVRAYRWDYDEEEDEEFDHCNFVYKDLKVCWYKHSNRGLDWYYKDKWRGELTSEFLEQMIEYCEASIYANWNLL